MKEFKDQAKLVPSHISCKYEKEMRSKSEVVSRFEPCNMSAVVIYKTVAHNAILYL